MKKSAEPTVLRRGVPFARNDDGTFTFEGTGISFMQSEDGRVTIFRSDSVPNVWLYGFNTKAKYV